MQEKNITPKIEQPTIREQRIMRQRQIIDAAMELAIEGGAQAVTVAAVAKAAGISRSAIYEYFASSADLIADLILEEMALYNNRIIEAVGDVEDPYEFIELWIAEALSYIIVGRHLLVKSLNSIETPNYRKSDIAIGHKKLMSTLAKPLEQIEIPSIALALSYLQNTIDVAAIRIESGNESALEIKYAQTYAIAGIRALSQGLKRD